MATISENPSEEMVQHITEDNQLIGPVKRGKMRSENLWHRVTFILVFNSKGELYVQKRTMLKDFCPGYYDIGAGGVMGVGEEYAECAVREAEEELGVHGVPLHFEFEFKHISARARCWGGVFSCVYDGPIVWQASEVESGKFMTIPDILSERYTEKFTPDGLEALDLYLERVHQRYLSQLKS